MDFPSSDPGPGAAGLFRDENPVRTTGGMAASSTICSGENDVSPLLLSKRRDFSCGFLKQVRGS